MDMEYYLKLIALFALGALLTEISGKFRENGGIFIGTIRKRGLFFNYTVGGNRTTFYIGWAVLILAAYAAAFAKSTGFGMYALCFAVGATINIVRFFIMDYTLKK